ncbi:MAG: hypothetical protein OXC80_01990 [Gammaproteobacteria bacterium]|nr:hypothetical protein [Gammaproteobacteria bacterium]
MNLMRWMDQYSRNTRGSGISTPMMDLADIWVRHNAFHLPVVTDSLWERRSPLEGDHIAILRLCALHNLSGIERILVSTSRLDGQSTSHTRPIYLLPRDC